MSPEMNVTKIIWVGLSLVLFVLFSGSANSRDKMSLTSLPSTNIHNLFFSEVRSRSSEQFRIHYGSSLSTGAAQKYSLNERSVVAG